MNCFMCGSGDIRHIGNMTDITNAAVVHCCDCLGCDVDICPPVGDCFTGDIETLMSGDATVWRTKDGIVKTAGLLEIKLPGVHFSPPFKAQLYAGARLSLDVDGCKMLGAATFTELDEALRWLLGDVE